MSCIHSTDTYCPLGAHPCAECWVYKGDGCLGLPGSLRYFLMLFGPHGMLFFPSPGKSSVFQIQVDDPRHSLPNPQMASTNFCFAVSSILHHILLCLFLKYTDFNWAGCSLKGDTVSTFVDCVFSNMWQSFCPILSTQQTVWRNKWMTCKSIVNMVCGSYHLGCRRWEVLLSPLFRRGKLDSGCFPGAPDVTQLTDRAGAGAQGNVVSKPVLLTATRGVLFVFSRK